jgi:hypothetical protein
MNRKEELAEEHWKYVESICKMMYITAFIHGVKHGRQSKD